MTTLLTQSQLAKALAIPDLTDPLVAPAHAMQSLIRLAYRALKQQWQCAMQTVRSSPVVPLENNYDRLNYPKYGAARDARYTRYITERYLLRTQTSSAVPDILAGLHGQAPDDLLLLLPGMVYRRDCIDRLHSAEPHQLDLWRVVDHRAHAPVNSVDLQSMIATVMPALLPGCRWRTVPSPHPYTEQGVQIDVHWHEQWVEVGECGLIASPILQQASLPMHSGLAMGLGLDRILMIRKNIPDIRLLRHPDPRVQTQMQDLSAYRPVSAMPAVRRDLSLVVAEHEDIDTLGDQVRAHSALSTVIESLEVLAESAFDQLPAVVQQRLGMVPGQKNLLLRLVIRALDRTLTDADANDVRNAVYRLLHQGPNLELADNHPGNEP